MTSRRLVSMSFVATAALLAAVLPTRGARAQTSCEVDADCGHGFECRIVGATGCGAATPTPACPPDEPCDPAPAPEPVPCESEVFKECVPGSCTSDAECASGMICHAYEVPCAVTDCACPSDVPDCGCGSPAPCTSEVKSSCTPTYLLPCAAAADCGEGFSCVEQQSCGCSGSAGSAERRPAPDPGFAPPAGGAGAGAEAPPDPQDPPDCACEPSGVFACVPHEIVCDDASDCPASWTCEQEVQATAPACSGDGCPAPAPQPPSRFLCQPPHYSGGGVVGTDAGGTPTSGGPKGNPGTANPEASPAPNGTDNGETRESAACQMGHAPASSGTISLLAVLGALLGLKRRRA